MLRLRVAENGRLEVEKPSTMVIGDDKSWERSGSNKTSSENFQAPAIDMETMKCALALVRRGR